jgi:hypothetical protein
MRAGRSPRLVTAAIALGCLSAGCSTGTRTSLRPTTSSAQTGDHVTTTSRSTTTSSRPPLPADPLAFVGKYGVTIRFVNADDGWAQIGDFSGSTQVAPRTERTTDGGRHWTLLPATTYATPIFNNGQVGWYIDHGLHLTTNGGVSWRRVLQPSGWSLGPLAVAGPATWLLETWQWRGLSGVGGSHSPPPLCATRVVLSSGLGRTPVLPPVEPRLHGSCYPTLTATSPETAFVFGIPTPDSFMMTTDGGHTWESGRTPCGALPGGSVVYFGGDGDDLFTDCAYGRAIDTAADKLGASYDSADGGRTWDRIGSPLARATTQMASGGAGVFWQASGLLGSETLQVSKDDGRSWSTLLPWLASARGVESELSARPRLRGVMFVNVVGLSAAGRFAALALEVYCRSVNYFVVGVTVDEGANWRWSYLRNTP